MQCPHCGKPIEFSEASAPPWYHPDRGPVSLGCGSLILIALIVSMFSSSRDSSDELRELRQQVQRLEQKIDALQQP